MVNIAHPGNGKDGQLVSKTLSEQSMGRELLITKISEKLTQHVMEIVMRSIK